MCLHTNCMGNIFFYGSPCVSSNFPNNGYSNLLTTQTAFTYHLWPMISIVSIHIIDTMTLFLTLTLHSWLKVYIVFFQTTDALKLFPTQTALTFPWPMVCNMVYQITDTLKMLLTQYTQTAFVFLFQSIRERERVYSNSDIVHTKIYM